MSNESPSFADLIRQVRMGDEDAAERLVRQYEVEIRREVRLRLTDWRLRQVIDSSDVCQSILANFFVRMRCGEFELDSPAQLRRLLVAMACNRVTDWARMQQTLRRNKRREVPLETGKRGIDLPGGGLSPSEEVAGEELAMECRRRLTEDERRVTDLRIEGKSWLEIAEELGDAPEAMRKRHQRAVERVTKELDLR